MGSLGDQPRILYKDDERFNKYLHEKDIVWNIMLETCLASAEQKYYNCVGNSRDKDLLNAIDLIVLQQYRLEILTKVTKVMSEGSVHAWNLVTGDLSESTELEEASALLIICAEARRAADEIEDMEDTRMPTMEDFQAKHPRPEWTGQLRKGALAAVGPPKAETTAQYSIPRALVGKPGELPALPEPCHAAPRDTYGTRRRSKRKRQKDEPPYPVPAARPPLLAPVARPPPPTYVDLTQDSDSDSTVPTNVGRNVTRSRVRAYRRIIPSRYLRGEEGMPEKEKMKMQDKKRKTGECSSNSIATSHRPSRESSDRSKAASLPRMVRNRTW